MDNPLAEIQVPEGAPLVSCVMPTRDRRDFLPQAIRYFQRQDYPDKELIILDDGASMADLVPDDPAIRYVQLPRRTSIGQKRNLGCEMARGPIIAQWDDDDWYADHRLRYQVVPLLDGHTHMTAVEGNLFWEIQTGRLWRCDANAAQELFPQGCFPSSLVYWRVVWERLSRYIDKSIGEVGTFVTRTQRGGAVLRVLSNLDTYVYVRHHSNTWGQFRALARKQQRRFSVSDDASQALPAADRAFYDTFVDRALTIKPSNKNLPLVTCVVTVRGQRALVERVIAGFSQQDYPNKELIVVDGGAGIADLIPDDERIRHVPLAGPVSLGDQLNRACALARGSIVAHFDVRDRCTPHRLIAQVRHLIESRGHLTMLSANGAMLPGTLVYWRVIWEQLTHYPRGTDDAEAIFVKAARFLGAVFSSSPSDGYVARDPGAHASPDQSEVQSEDQSDDDGVQGTHGKPRLPLITCVMPTYNRAPFIETAIAYFQRQDYPSKELLIIDDSDSEADIDLPAQGDVVYLYLPRRTPTLGDKRNLLCELARGDIIAHWDDDDWFAPSRLRVQVEPLLYQGAHLAVLYCRDVLFLDRGEVWTARAPRFVDTYLMFWKVLWSELAKYGQRNVGESMTFYRQARTHTRIAAVRDGDQAVYVRHTSNTYQPARMWTRAFPLRKAIEDVIPADDVPFYYEYMGIAVPTQVSAQSHSAPSSNRSQSITIALLVPVTSRGRHYASIGDTELLQRLLPSFVATATFDRRTRYRVYVGCDRGDPFFDHPGNREELARAFAEIVEPHAVELVVHACEGTEHAPMWVWNELFHMAHEDSCDYFYQLGDDVELQTPGWAVDFELALGSNPHAPGVGVVGPLDPRDPKLITQTFVSRLHMDIFGTYYPKTFKNWWGDDWLMAVYSPEHCFWRREYVVRNSEAHPRYQIDRGAQKQLDSEVARGRAHLDSWLRADSSGPAPGATIEIERDDDTAQPPGRRILSFSLWGTKPCYTVGAIRNAELAREIYPDWTCRFYVGTSVPTDIVRRIDALPNTEVVDMGVPGDWTAMFWRFLPAAEPDVAIMVSRDTDSRLSRRERAAVAQWLESADDFHIMRDHPQHSWHILGGMWGVRNGLLGDIVEGIRGFRKYNDRGVDQDFLRVQIYPAVRAYAFVHDEFFENRPFPTPRQGLEFVGEPFDEFDRPLNDNYTRTLEQSLSGPGGLHPAASQ